MINPATIICLMGPTAAGKSHIAIELAKKIPLEIVSVDSAMVYCGMDIGTAKPSLAERQQIPHHLIDICDPIESYSAGLFRQDALREIENILLAGRVPLLVGGTMMYFHVLQKGLSELPTANVEIRAKIQAEAKQGWELLHARLQQVDPIAANRIHPKDSQRIARALEVYEATGRTLTAMTQEYLAPLPYRSINLAIAPAQRTILHERVAKRFDMMLQQDFVAEVEKLFYRGDLHADLPAMRTVGYRQVWDYLSGKLSYDEMKERAIITTRQLAKRQLTWLRGWENLLWFDSEDVNLFEKLLRLSAVYCDLK